MKKIIIFILSLFVSVIVLANSDPMITVSIAPEKYFVQMIAKNTVQVNILVPSNSEPEYYSLTPQQLVQLNNSSLYFELGVLPFEQNINSKIKNIAPHTKVISVSQGMPLSANPDPHIWLSVNNGQIMAKNIYQALCDMYPQNIDFYTKNYNKLQQHNEKINKEITYILKKFKGNSFITYHPAFYYFATDYGLKEVAIESDGKQPSPQQLANVYNFAKENHIYTIFIQSQFNDKPALTLAKQLRAQVIYLNPMQENWANNMLNIATKLSGSFQVGSNGFKRI